jgi:DNA-binding transcriptional ArsR family regulator
MSDEKYCLTFILEKSILANMKQRTNFAKLQKAAPVAAKLLKAIAHRERLLILCQLSQTEQNVGQLLEHSLLSQSAFSQHLGVLKRQKLVKTRKEAQTVFYSLANDDVAKILKLLHEIYCK